MPKQLGKTLEYCIVSIFFTILPFVYSLKFEKMYKTEWDGTYDLSHLFLSIGGSSHGMHGSSHMLEFIFTLVLYLLLPTSQISTSYTTVT